MSSPLIGISGRRWPATTLGDLIPPAIAHVELDIHLSDYSRALARAGGVPVELARDADVAELMSHLDGVVLSGGADIDPTLYGAVPDENLGPIERERDEWELALIRVACEHRVPVLAICRGLQLVNVAFGGTLRQHVELAEGAGHPRWDEPGGERTHRVELVAPSRLRELLGESVDVNSLHHQVVESIGRDLTVTARATDGVVEGLESSQYELLAVQWHPELFAEPDPTFAWLVTRAREAKSRRKP